MKTCSGCRYVVYCSEQCQQEDWMAFHAKECASMSLQGKFSSWAYTMCRRLTNHVGNSISAGRGLPISLHVRQERLTLLLAIAQQAVTDTVPYIMVFESTATHLNTHERDGYSLAMTHGIPAKPLPDMEGGERVASFWHDISQEPRSSMLILGIFAIDTTRLVHVWAKLSFIRAQDGRYNFTFVSSFTSCSQ